MSKNSNSGGKGSTENGQGSGGGRPATGFPGGNWPSTTPNPSGGGRGNAPAKGSK